MAMAHPGTPPRKTLIIHIGDHKTGSTSIQMAFAEGRISLDHKRLFYPAALASNMLKRQFIAWARAKTAAEKKQAARPLQSLADQIRRSDADYVVISGEEFEWIPHQVFQKVITQFFADTADAIRIIAYVRPHASRIISSFCERTKIGVPVVLNQTPDEFARTHQERGTFAYHTRFQNWRQLYGDNFLLRPMIRSQLRQGSVVNDFIEHAFPDEPYKLQDDSSSNESLELTDLMRLKVLQRQLQHHKQPIRHQIGWEFIRLIAQKPPAHKRVKLQLHQALADALYAAYREDAQAMDRDFFDGQPLLEDALSTARDGALAQPQSVEPADYISAEELRMLEVMASFLVSTLDNDSVDWSNFFHHKRIEAATEARRTNLAST